MSIVKSYLSLIKFSHTIFALPFALIGFSLGLKTGALSRRDAFSSRITMDAASGQLQFNDAFGQPVNPLLHLHWPLFFHTLLLVLVCMITARSAAMAFNRYLDRRWDALNPRTAIREIPKGIITPGNALLFTLLSCSLFIIATFFINRICFYLSPVALAVVLGYSYTKRFTPFCHLVLGVGLALAPIGAFLAVTGVFHWLPILFSLAVLFWVSGFDIIYALQDEEFDKSHQLYSIPAWLGKAKALHVSEALHVLSGAAIVAAGRWGHFGGLYWVGALVFGGMLVYQHSIVKPTDLRRVNLAFMTANGIASVVFAAFVMAAIFVR